MICYNFFLQKLILIMPQPPGPQPPGPYPIWRLRLLALAVEVTKVNFHLSFRKSYKRKKNLNFKSICDSNKPTKNVYCTFILDFPVQYKTTLHALIDILNEKFTVFSDKKKIKVMK